jgi:AcrR family transcriptional regulator
VAVSYSTDPRAARSRDAILVAARHLLSRNGPGAVTHQRVAQEAGVGRATVYRHWARPEQLLFAAMDGVDLPLFKDPETPVRPWLHRQLRQMAEELAPAAVAGMSLAFMQSAIWDPEAARRSDESNGTIRDRIHAAVRSAVARRELDSDLDPADLAAMLVGPIVYRAVVQRDVASDELIDRLLDGIGNWHAVHAFPDRS